MKLSKSTFMLSLAIAAATMAQENLSQWTYHKVLRVNTTATGASVASTQTNFPVLVRLTTAHRDVFAYSFGRGADLRFSKADGVTTLPYQVERWDSAASKAEIWVLLDSVKANDSTAFRMYWSKTGSASLSNPSAVFTTTNGYAGVWHLGTDSVGVSKDATANLNHATRMGASTPLEGVVGSARLFNAAGSGDIDTVGINQSLNMSANDRITISAWVRRDGGNSSGSAFEGIAGVFDWNSNGTGVNNRMYSLVHNANNGYSMHISTTGGDGANETIVNTSIIGDGTWTHVAGTVDGSNINLYVNGVSAAQQAFAGNIFFPTSLAGVGPFTIGKLDDNGGGELQFFYGGIDEVRLSNVARSADYMKLSYQNQRSGSTTLALGATTPPSPPVSIATGSRSTLGEGFRVTSQGNRLSFVFPETSQDGVLSLLDAAGRTVWSTRVNAGSRSLERASNIGPGVYSARFATEYMLLTRRVVQLP